MAGDVRPLNGLEAGPVEVQAEVLTVFANAVENDGGSVVRLRREALAEAGRRGGKFIAGELPLGGEWASLELTSLRVAGPRTRVVVGEPGGVDRPFDYDTTQVQVFRGRVQGRPNSSVVLFSSPRRTTGHIDLGGPGGRFKLSSSDPSGRVLAADEAVVVPAPAASAQLPDAPFCGNHSESVVAGCQAEPPAGQTFNKRLKTVEIALETDYDLYANFNDPASVMDYIVEVMARTNGMFMEEASVRFEIVFVRLFDNPANEPGFMNNSDPLAGYVSFWNANMKGVARDTGAFLSGRRDLPYGGVAYIGAVCTDSAYCVCGYLKGFHDPDYPSWGDYDTTVVAHELGHNFNSYHTPDYCPPIDRCFPLPAQWQRGSMMSYCSQTVSGGDLAEEFWYHTRVRRVMRDFVENGGASICVVDDCNQNNVDDATDIAGGTPDVNVNGVPDACEDCQPNGILDPADIAGPSDDDNLNGVPDECEPDCNLNGVPDDRDIFLGTSADLWGNGIPDECEADCDGDGTPDYNEIQANMLAFPVQPQLDIDRNAVLDSCQDCDGDGTNDLVELMGARNAWVASDVLNYIGEHHAVSGVRVRKSAAGMISLAQDLIIVPGMNAVLVSGGTTHKVVRYDASTGAYVSDFVPAGSGGLNNAAGLVMGPNGNLFVSSRNSHSVLQYNGTTGAFIGAFVTAGSGGLSNPFGLVFGPNGNLFVNSANQVFEYNGASGAFVRIFVPAAGNGGLNQARGMLFKPDGNLLVASYTSDAILQYNGTTGAFLGKWNSGGTASALYLDGPWGLRLGHNGNVFCTRDLPSTFIHNNEHDDDGHDHGDDVGALHVTSARIMEFDIAHGKYVRSYVLGEDTELRSTTGFDFMPATGDCNFNMLQDSCDIALCGGDPACMDCNSNNQPDGCDIASCGGNLSLCDCNTNGRPDGCDIASGILTDENANNIPDECEPPPQPMADPNGDKTRTLSFTAPAPAAATGTFGQTAVLVTMLDLQNPSPPNAMCCPAPDFGGFEAAICSAADELAGCARWVGPPGLFLESQENPGVGAFKAARLQCTPFYHNWGSEGLVHVVAAEIVPSSLYEVKVYAAVCKGNEAGCQAVSNGVLMATHRAGDIVTPFQTPGPPLTQPDALDVTEAVNKFRNIPGAQKKVVVQVQPDLPEMNGDINAIDIVAVVNNFQGFAYPYGGPCPCPSTVACNAVPCASSGPCGAGLCVQTCATGPRTGEPCKNNLHCGECAGGTRADYPCDGDGDCPGSTCTLGTCGAGFCRDRCGRCN
jgi:hypothetical protein